MTTLHALILTLIVCALLMQRMAKLKSERDTYKRERDTFQCSTHHLETELRRAKVRNFVLQRELTDARWLIDGALNQMVRAQR